MSNHFAKYFDDLRRLGADQTEHAYRTAFQNFLEAVKGDDNIHIIHEPKREKGFGAPDFRIERNGAIIGYIETKKFGANLNKALKTKQLARYLTLCNNLILTNYNEFILIKNGEAMDKATLFSLTDLKIKRAKLQDTEIMAITKLFSYFFTAEPLSISDSQKLALHLADRGKILKEFIFELVKYRYSDNFSKKIIGLYQTFKATLVEDLKPIDFADAYAQTVIYGFFLARLQSTAKITLDDASRLVPRSFQVIKELFNFISGSFSIPNHIRWIFSEIINLINNIDLTGIQKTLSFRNANKEIDPYLYFYETFLGEFDKAKRKSKGVYYTPTEVVGFIIRSINKILMTEFGKANGFADPSVTVLDFATGTGTFLVTIFKMILEGMAGSKGSIKSLISDHLLKNFYGFEYLVAPYAIAHLKLSQLLKDNGYELTGDERLQIYLTDTLDDSKHKENFLFPFISEEGARANEIKVDMPILVITGNPPYSMHSTTASKWVDDYKPNDEKNVRQLHDDYIKFIRFAHKKMENVKQGAIGIISNNSFLNGLTHRKMRVKLATTFDTIYILNLHGNTRLHETHPDGGIDQNVFDIMQGVSINIFVKKRGQRDKCKIYYYDLYGRRNVKFGFLLANDIDSVEWQELQIDKFDREFRKTRWGKIAGLRPQ